MATGPGGRVLSFMPTGLLGTPAAPTVLTGCSASAGTGNYEQKIFKLVIDQNCVRSTC